MPTGLLLPLPLFVNKIALPKFSIQLLKYLGEHVNPLG